MVANVLVEIKARSIDKTFTYNVPKQIDSSIKIGSRVLVPFGKQKVEGFVLKLDSNLEDQGFELKDVIELIDKEPVINSEMIELGKYLSRKTLSTLISAYQTMLPAALKAHKGFNINKKYETYLQLNNILIDEKDLKNIKQQEIYNLIKEEKEVLKSMANKISTSSVKTLIDKGVIKEIKREVYRLNEKYEKLDDRVVLNEEQENAISKVNLNIFKPYLLHGVTGSGKTEVYMSLIEGVQKSNKETIVLVPEISLTPQLVDVFRKRFGSTVAILHSRLSDGEKYDEWRKIEKKQVSIVIGARSAIFAPFTNLGMIIIDEEHSSTYKQENSPRYNTIDIALYRAKRYKCPVVLGSATPSIESYTRAMVGNYELIEMKKRVNNNLPTVKLIDMANEIKKGHPVFSTILEEKISECLKNGEQSILLLNRRGFSTVNTCKNCGHVDKCPNCDIPLIYHKTTNSMKCHYCGYINSKLISCPSCKSTNFNDFGMGTEKLEQLIVEKFKSARVIRMDVDTTKNKGSHEKIINAFREQKYDILIGTQMISKGLDFPNVTLVGVINGDASLNVPDFRSGERTYQLLNQVAGRAGRNKLPGLVIIQGFNISHYSIVKASNHDYKGFYNEEMKIRKKLNYPPYYNLAQLIITSKNYDVLVQESNKIGSYLRDSLINKALILGPSASSMPKINNTYYYQVLIKYKNSNDIINELYFINNQYKSKSQLKVEIDLNPIKI